MLHENIRLKYLITVLLLAIIPLSYANTQYRKDKDLVRTKHLKSGSRKIAITPVQPDAVQQRADDEAMQDTNPFVLSLYQPNYLLPAYYTFSPYHKIYQDNTPDAQKIQHVDVKFQFSIKIPIIVKILHLPSTLYLAYTQLSYWQAYNHSPFFRESNYEPALFISNNINWQWPFGWQMKFLNIGAMHESNGKGGKLERSWNRLYSEFIFGKGRWMVEFEPWFALDDSSIRLHNPDIEHYLGHGLMIVAYKIHNNTISLKTYNNLESGFHRGSFQLSWSFPISTHLKGYVQYFNGFGQSLIEYNHRTSNSFGVGISISDWI